MKKAFVFIVSLLLIILVGCNSEPQISSSEISSIPEENDKSQVVEVEEIVPTGNTANLMNPLKGGYDEAAEEMRKKVIDSTDELEIKGNTYYISAKNGNDDNDGLSPEKAWKTFDALSGYSFLFEEGDTVLFERNGIYRQTSPFVVNKSLTFGAYGEGNKPAIYGSQKNYSEIGLWEPSRKKNVWKLSLNTLDAGIIVFNHGVEVGTKQNGLLNVEKNGDFYHNTQDGILYLYLDKGYPDQVYESIEIGTKGNMFHLSPEVSDVTFDNLCLKYGGAHGIGTQGPAYNIKITNCEIGWIGGSLHDATKDPDLRYGNAIQFWATSENCVVENNWVYQCFDTGITFQGGTDANDRANTYKNVKFVNNLIEYCTYNIELWDRVPDTSYENVVVEGNIMRFAGYGWGAQRTNSSYTSHLFIGDLYDTNMKNFSISNNIFDCSNMRVIYWGDAVPLDSNGNFNLKGLTVKNNSYYQKPAASDSVLIYCNKRVNAFNNNELTNAIKIIDSSPKKIEWAE